MDVDDDEDNPDVRINKRLANSLLAHDNEYFGGKYDTKEKDKSGYNLDVTPTGSRADPESDEESQASNAKSDTPAERTFSRRPTLGMSAQWDGFHSVHPAPQVQLNSPGNFQDTPNTQSPIFFVGSPQSNSGESKQFNGDGAQNGSDNNDSKLRLSPPTFSLNSNDEDKSSVKGSQTSSPTSRRSPRIMQQNLNNSNEDRSEKEGEENKMDWEAIDKELDWSMEDTNTNTNNNENTNGENNNNGNSNENNSNENNRRK
ncbi:hypothetical protein CONCODRAFT_78592 [Conidiobolus coronatus NRRL 28638]|uniref:Uncharacterized protein n=1 Tax=Conidiobolus coronatus (strain ATCC 28846 / CBS 209.66 / NRRL 28638) TaxID=796925 RepID=A0A137P7I3_CONC2|nr:hypothetical protein CONCODRAFT_78592 [Conidiobolus coronatus NRRL 28638]|eukprot:KXN70958.1 hypothetical protein CONCODRAFT_78592 [Conidiobolus coronatus NRRL 28638]